MFGELIGKHFYLAKWEMLWFLEFDQKLLFFYMFLDNFIFNRFYSVFKGQTILKQLITLPYVYMLFYLLFLCSQFRSKLFWINLIAFSILTHRFFPYQFRPLTKNQTFSNRMHFLSGSNFAFLFGSAFLSVLISFCVSSFFCPRHLSFFYCMFRLLLPIRSVVNT